MSKTTQGRGESYAPPAQRPASGLFFLCSFLLLILIPASGYFEIWAKACLNGGSPATAVFESGGMTMSRPNRSFPQTAGPVAAPKSQMTGKEIAGDAEGAD